MNEEKSKRNPCGIRMDLIPPEILLEISKVFALGAKKYGDYNWQKSKGEGENSPINHALKHILSYSAGIPDDEETDMKAHLTHAIVNLIFEYWWETKRPQITTEQMYNFGKDIVPTTKKKYFYVDSEKVIESTKEKFDTLYIGFRRRCLDTFMTTDHHGDNVYYYHNTPISDALKCANLIQKHFYGDETRGEPIVPKKERQYYFVNEKLSFIKSDKETFKDDIECIKPRTFDGVIKQNIEFYWYPCDTVAVDALFKYTVDGFLEDQ